MIAVARSRACGLASVRMENQLARLNKRRVRFQFTLQQARSPPGQLPRTLAFLGLFAVLAVLSLRSATRLRALALAALTILAFNWLLHCFFGAELILYSLHWLVAIPVVFAGSVVSGHRQAGWILLGGLILLVVLNNACVLRYMFAALASAGA